MVLEKVYSHAKTIKLLEENIAQKLHDLGFGNEFLSITPKVHFTKEDV